MYPLTHHISLISKDANNIHIQYIQPISGYHRISLAIADLRINRNINKLFKCCIRLDS